VTTYKKQEFPYNRRGSLVTHHSALIPTAFTIFAATIAVSAARAPQKPPARIDPAVMAKSVGEMTADEEQQFSDAAEATIERVCVACHPFEKIIKTRRTPPAWNDQVTLMKGRGAPGTDADFAAIRKYLIRWYGVVNVNTAPAEDLTSVLGLSPQAAANAVDYRKAHGDFADLAAFAKVEGVDRAKLEEQPEALLFK